MLKQVMKIQRPQLRVSLNSFLFLPVGRTLLWFYIYVLLKLVPFCFTVKMDKFLFFLWNWTVFQAFPKLLDYKCVTVANSHELQNAAVQGCPHLIESSTLGLSHA